MHPCTDIRRLKNIRVTYFLKTLKRLLLTSPTWFCKHCNNQQYRLRDSPSQANKPETISAASRQARRKTAFECMELVERTNHSSACFLHILQFMFTRDSSPCSRCNIRKKPVRLVMPLPQHSRPILSAGRAMPISLLSAAFAIEHMDANGSATQ